MRLRLALCILTLAFGIAAIGGAYAQDKPKIEKVLQLGHSAAVTSVAYSPDGKTALSGSLDSTVRLWDLATGREIRKLEGHSFWVTSVTFSPDGKTALSGSDDGTMRLWKLQSGEELAALIASRDGEYMTFTPSGFFAASPKAADMLAVVRGFESYSVLQFYEHLHRPDLVAERLKGDHESKYWNAAKALNLETILDSGPVPKLEPLRNGREGGKAELAIRLTDRGGGIGEKVIWRVNGVAQGKDTAPGLGGPVLPGNYVVVEQTLYFDPKQSAEIEVVAHNGKGLLATLPLRFTFDPIFGFVDKRAPHLFVLAVGIDKYLKTDWQLHYAANDATSIAAALKAAGGAFFSENNVEVKTVLNEDATEQGIGAAFAQLAAKIEPQDVFILFLGGHGRAIADTGWFFLPQNLDPGTSQTVADNAIGPAKLEGWLREIRASKSIVVLDSCESGAARGENLETESAVKQFTFQTGRATISAAAQGQAAMEDPKLGHGVLTYAILEALNKQDGAGDELVKLHDLADHVKESVRDISTREFGVAQKPEIDLGKSDNFTFGIRRLVLKEAVPECKLPDQPDGPSHIVTRAVSVRDKPSDDAAATGQLTETAFVTLKACAGTWGLVARGGKDIGYVPLAALKAGN